MLLWPVKFSFLIDELALDAELSAAYTIRICQIRSTGVELCGPHCLQVTNGTDLCAGLLPGK